MEGDVKKVLNDRDGEILSIEASHKFEEWFGIKEIGEKIEKRAKEFSQDIQLDNLTRGSGNCFPIAILQQLNRKEIHQKLDSKLKETAAAIDHLSFRTRVAMFMLKSKLPHVLSYKEQVEEITGLKWKLRVGKGQGKVR